MSRKRRNKRTSNKNADEEAEEGFTAEALKRILPLNDIEINQISEEESLQELWAGYGSVSSFSIELEHPKLSDLNNGILRNMLIKKCNRGTLDLIVKRVNAPKSSSSSISHKRKMKSYEVESNFYQHVAPVVHRLLQSSTTLECTIPTPYSIQVSPSFTFVMSDLRTKFTDPYCQLDETRTRTALKWLASFHAVFWEMDTVILPQHGNGDDNENPIALWESAGYWHLQTRLQELEDIPSYGEWSVLKTCAYAIDERMQYGRNEGNGAKECSSTDFKTICHGDFKKANLLFTEDGMQCASFDFQYCGGGYGMKDVVMLIVSSISSEVLMHKRSGENDGERTLLKFYHTELIKNLRTIGRLSNDRIEKYNFNVALAQYEIALIDYVRFMAGWGFWGSNCGYSQDRVKVLLNRIAGKITSKPMHLLSPEEWREAIFSYYPHV